MRGASIGCLLLTTLLLTGPARAQSLQRTGTVHFSDELVIGEIHHLEISDTGEMLLLDHPGRQVLLLHADGSLKANLDPLPCHPGFEMFPINARFGPDYILMTNARPWGMRFDLAGRCIGGMADDFKPPFDWAIDGEGHIIGTDVVGDHVRLTIRDSTGRLLREQRIDGVPSLQLVLRHQIRGKQVVGNRVFMGFITLPGVRIHDTRTGSAIGSIGAPPARYRPVRRDLPTQADDRLLRALRELLTESSILINVFRFSENSLLLQYRDSRHGVILQELNLQGRVLREEVLGEGTLPFITARNGRLYRTVQPEMRPDGEVPNPFLEVFEFAGARK
jgi:hypothetical protein